MEAFATDRDLQRVAAYFAAHPGGWDDDPASFFPAVTKGENG